MLEIYQQMEVAAHCDDPVRGVVHAGEFEVGRDQRRFIDPSDVQRRARFEIGLQDRLPAGVRQLSTAPAMSPSLQHQWTW